MKEMIIIGIIALFATAWVLDTGSPPQPEQEGIIGVQESKPISTRKTDNQQTLGDFKIKDGFAPIRYRAGVFDDDDPAASSLNNSDFPLSGGARRI